ncbi:MAG: adenosylcobalamin-dependent ribonucleoside-diphosphate reductase [Nanoarchaeota archaeon]|nr:adenosylcobalamin-dependent ribonucleoside-diphosphate reductase [Nanoarchaeota archaeon]MBU1644406.1 adenosylcobalamin-dependent ribonucleoside-diphosphate reductase [Nanoarchaeota archaeon]MBU1977510.1 adenosylcobalamin-dependent ribonucleoside-diphosphate reductase [Nanoarchaeota archaeon]
MEELQKKIEEPPFKQIRSIIKRDGRIEEFNINKITEAIFKAAQTVGGKDDSLAKNLALEVCLLINQKFQNQIPTVDDVQDLVEKTLIENGHAKTGKAFILYRHKKNEDRERRALITGSGNAEENLSFSNEALKILQARYLLKDDEGKVVETPREMIRRVAKNIAKADKAYGTKEEELKETEERFYNLMTELKFLPNSPTLMNAHTKSQQLSSCFVLPVEDNMEGIFSSLKSAALIHQRGSGTGFSFSRLRPRGDFVGKNSGVAAGPIDFMKVYDKALETIKQGGVRPGANMAVLKVDHPDIIRFIEAKRNTPSLKNFNLSIAVTDRFMKSVEADREYYLTNPKSDKYVGKLRAKDVFAMITQNAWKTGDPGLIFIDEINRKHPAKHLGEIETTNQCGEAPLLPHEGIVLGSINLNKFIDWEKNDVVWEDLKETVKTAVHFLDNVIDMNSYPTKKIEEHTKRTRKFGLGVMGFADLLIKLNIKYDSEEGLELAEKLMSFIKDTAYEKSEELADKKGPCPAWEESEHQRAGRKMRNMSCISISPTGTISLLVGASSGCEPLFAISYQRTLLGDRELVYLNPEFERVAKEKGFYSPQLIREVSRVGNVQHLKEIPKSVRDVFVTAQDIAPEWHVRMQATLQQNVDNSISKTINFSNSAAIKDIENAYMLAWKAKCKGITIYRDGSHEDQVINIGD